MRLSSEQLSKLLEYVDAWVKELNFPVVGLAWEEKKFTADYLLPWLRGKVAELAKPGLYVRGDGGPTVHPVVWSNIAFYPDLAIVSDEEKLVAFEVKLIREVDPGSSLSKAIGQSILYSSFGYKVSRAIVVDCRDSQKGNSLMEWRGKIINTNSSETHVFY